jgi:hypothetical protein
MQKPQPLKRPRRWSARSEDAGAAEHVEDQSIAQRGSCINDPRSPEINQAEEIVRAVKLPKNAPPDQRLAMLAVGGAYQPAHSHGPAPARHAPPRLARPAKTSRRKFNFAWRSAGERWRCWRDVRRDVPGFLRAQGLKEAKKQIRVGRLPDFANAGVYEQYKPIGIWVVNSSAREEKLMALPRRARTWAASRTGSGEQKFKCPCHGRGITSDRRELRRPHARGRWSVLHQQRSRRYIVVDMSKVIPVRTWRMG